MERIAQRVLYAGVTGFLDLFGDEQSLIDVRNRQRSGLFIGADIYASLSCLTAPEGHCTEYGIPTRTMSTPDEARAVVADLAAAKPDVVKIVYQPSDDQPSIDKPTFQAAVATADAFGISTVVHIKTWQDVLDAVEVGATAVTHVPKAAIPDDVPKRMAEAGLMMIPTLTVETDLTDFVFDPSVIQTPLPQAMTIPSITRAYSSAETLSRWADRETGWRISDAEKIRSVNRINTAGVELLVGTDSGNWGTIQGYSVHRELLKLTQAGLSNWEALASATTKASAFLGIRYGFAPGAQASFVVLDASPIEEIANTQRIRMVIHHGKVVDRDNLLRSSFE